MSDILQTILRRKAEEMQSAGHPIVIMGETDFKRALTDAGVV